MSAINFNIGGGADPLLGTPPDYSAHFAEIEKAQKVLELRKQELAKMAQGAPETQASTTPIWDEIDTITGNMSATEYQAMLQNPEFQESLAALNEYVGAVQLKMLRPVIEQSEQGKKILEQHLTTVKFLRKSASAEVDRTLADFKEYTEHYSHLSYDEYLKTKGGGKS